MQSVSTQFEPDDIGKVPFLDILNVAMPAIRTKTFINIDYDELKMYVGYIQYNVQRDLFELADEAVLGTIDWKNFVLMMRGAKLFSDKEGTFLAGLFLHLAEQTHFNHLRDTMHPDYRWEEYRLDLQRSHELWMEVLTAFRNTILGLDFKELWEAVDVDFELKSCCRLHFYNRKWQESALWL